MDLFELEIKNLTPASNMGSTNGVTQDSYTLVKFTNVSYATASNGGATGVVTSSNSGNMGTISPAGGLFYNATGPNLASADSVALRTWFNSIPNIGKAWTGVATGTMNTQVAFCPANDGQLLVVLANNGTVVNNLPVFYNNNVGIAFDNSKISAAAFDLYPATAVLNCLGDQEVLLLGSPILNVVNLC